MDDPHGTGDGIHSDLTVHCFEWSNADRYFRSERKYYCV